MDTRKPYPTDVSDEEWALISSYLELLPEASCQRSYASRDVFNALRYVVRSGIQWRMLPHDFYMDASLLQGIFNAVQTRKVAALYPALCAANAAGPDEIR